VLGIGIRGTARDKRYLNPLRYKHHPLKESTAMSESVEERSKEEEGMGTLHGSGSLSEGEFSVEEQARSLEVDAFLEEFCDGSAILDAEQLL
jgi:hypothetical protein